MFSVSAINSTLVVFAQCENTQVVKFYYSECHDQNNKACVCTASTTCMRACQSVCWSYCKPRALTLNPNTQTERRTCWVNRCGGESVRAADTCSCVYQSTCWSQCKPRALALTSNTDCIAGRVSAKRVCECDARALIVAIKTAKNSLYLEYFTMCKHSRRWIYLQRHQWNMSVIVDNLN